MNTKLRSKAYIISTVILLLVALGGVLWMGFSGGGSSTTPVAATPEVAAQLQQIDELEVTEVQDRAAAEELVRAGDVDAAVLPDAANPTGLLVLAESEAPQSLLLMLSAAPTVELLEPDGATWGMRYALGLIFGLIFMMAAITFGSPITTSVVEEKATRVIEILLSTIPARVLLAGKVIGNTILAMAQILLLAAVVVIGMIVSGQVELLKGIGGPIVWFSVFFFFGFILLAAMFAAAGSLVSRQEDVGATMTPVMYLTMIPYFLVIFFGQNTLVMTILSYVPFSAPVAMPIRLFFDEALWWEPLAALAILLATCVAVVALGGKIYENSLLKMGARVKFREALRG
ncbi:ABC transporter permease [Microbacterium sp. NIBRBAC000506063]|uniref:ABC transporter permease n=1 Tax=Microbacterium sp. NIBRBAC000506063 TaxID=2734618 RepID=UPI001BB4A17A|nr:ABC transporter permease [Microbacterium sp. NIBRBAC000506063]QTV80633.1 ABC transporter permease [Microbacterium sp. NIBRBAC000506063]